MTTTDEPGSLELVVDTVVDDAFERYCRWSMNAAWVKDMKQSLVAQLKLLGGWSE